MPPLPRILIVEDEGLLAENLKTFLGRRSPEVRIAPDGERALELLKTFTPEVVVMDLALPGIDGLEAYAEIVRRRARPVGCVMITGHPTDDLAERAGRRGIRHVLYKPFSLAELQRLVDRLAEEYFKGEHFCGAAAARGPQEPDAPPPSLMDR